MLTIDNLSNQDALVMLTSTLRETCFLAVYVRAHEGTKIEHIRSNSNGYWMLYEQGSDYSSETGLFAQESRFYRLPRILHFNTVKDGGSHWGIKIGENNSEKAITKDEFQARLPASPRYINVRPAQ